MKNRFSSIRNVMRHNDSGRVLARSFATPLAIYDEPGGGAGGDGGAGGGSTGGAAKTYTQADLDKEVSGLKTKNAELLDKVKKAGERVKDLPEDATAEEIAEALTNQRKSKQDQLEAKGKYDELIRQMGEKHTTEKTKLQGQIDTLNTRIKTREKTIAIRESLPEGVSFKILSPHIMSQLDVVENGDEYEVFVVDAKGQPVVDAAGKKKTVAALMAEMAEDKEFDGIFPAPKVGGGGARGGGGGQQSGNGDIILTNEQAKDVPTYRKAKAAAEKNGGNVVIRG